MNNQTFKRWFILGGLLVVTLWLMWGAPETEYNTSIVKAAAKTNANVSVQTKRALEDIKDEDVLLLSQRLPYQGKSVDLFGTAVKQQHTSKDLVVAKPSVKPIPKKATAPPLPFKYIGKLIEGDVMKIFLLKGDALHIVSEGDTVDKHYQLKHVDEQQLSWIYLPLNITQNMSIGRTP